MKARGLLLTRADLDREARALDADRALREAYGRVLTEGVPLALYEARFYDIWDYLRDGPRRRVNKAADAAAFRKASRTPGYIQARAKARAKQWAATT